MAKEHSIPKALDLPQFPDQPVSWTNRDVLLFANSIGCTEDDLQYLYESQPGFTAFPTYPIVLSFKHTHTDTVDFRQHFDTFINVSIPGVPRMDSRRVVDGGRTMKIIRPIPTTSKGREFRLRTKVTDVRDKGDKGTIIALEHILLEILESKEEIEYTRMTELAFYLGQGGWGGPKGGKPEDYPPPKGEEPTIKITHQVPRTAHLLYRLNGDYNPLHADPESDASAGFGGVIMHGLYTWNTTCRLILGEFTRGRSIELREFQAQFVKPVRPGDTLTVEAWMSKPSNIDLCEVRFVTKVNGDQLCLKNGRALLRVKRSPKESKI